MNLRSIDEAVAMLAEAFGQKFTPARLMAYEAGLADIDLRTVGEGVMRSIRECQFMPSVFELRQLCGAKSNIPLGKDRPTIAWGDVRRAISRVGGYDSPNFNDPLIHAVIRQLGGWPALCDSTSEELVWREKDFLRTYAAMMQMNVPSEQLERLAGIAEKENGPCFPALIVDVGCLGTGTIGEHRRLEEKETVTKRISGPNPAAAMLATKLEFDDRTDPPPILRLPVRSKDDQIAALARMRG